MTQSNSQYVIGVSDDGIHVKVDFLAHHRDKSPCAHRAVSFNRRDNELTCCDCGGKVNPVIWIADYAEQLYRYKQKERINELCKLH